MATSTFFAVLSFLSWLMHALLGVGAGVGAGAGTGVGVGVGVGNDAVYINELVTNYWAAFVQVLQGAFDSYVRAPINW